MDECEKRRKDQQRAARDQHLNDIQASLDKGSRLIEDSQREIQRSRDLLQDMRDQDERDDAAEDSRNP